LILQDIFCGVVPMGAENRAWRQRTGRLAQYLSKEATQVSRIFCGLEQRLK
jgi:adenosyl cobinamide kinase/adenosyl cobinamide phosphate guanylyltransferase